MATTVFIPQIWAARLLANLDKTLVYAALCNRNYEGEITGQGSIVKVQKLSGISVRDYAGDMTTDELDGTNTDLAIDQAKYFNFNVEDILKVQSKPELVDAAMKDAAYALADVCDQHVVGMYTEAGTTVGSDTSPVVATTVNDAYDSLVDLGVALTEKNVPSEGRFVVVPAWYEGLFRKDSRLIAAGDTNSEATRINGHIGKIAGFNVYVSNNVPNVEGAKYKILAGTNAAMSFAQQITKTETLRHPKRFADNVRGLHVYGSKVMQPNAMAVLVASKS